jgi:hypothetical protein
MSYYEDFPGVMLEDADVLTEDVRNLPADHFVFISVYDGEFTVGMSSQDAEQIEEMIEALRRAIDVACV